MLGHLCLVLSVGHAMSAATVSFDPKAGLTSTRWILAAPAASPITTVRGHDSQADPRHPYRHRTPPTTAYRSQPQRSSTLARQRASPLQLEPEPLPRVRRHWAPVGLAHRSQGPYPNR